METVTRYAYSLRVFHGAVATGVLSAFAFVQAAKRTKDKPTIRKLMKYHKSIGLLTGSLIACFIYSRIKTKIPSPLPAPNWQQTATKLSTFGLYSCVIFMPLSGIAMGYFGGHGIPFFGLFKFPGKSKPNKNIGNKSYFVHKRVGKIFEGLVLLHIGAFAFHVFQGDKIIPRMSPFDGKDEEEDTDQ